MSIRNLTTLFLLLLALASQAKRVQSQTAVAIKEFDGKLYQMQYQQWREIEYKADLSAYEIKPQQWQDTIKNAESNTVVPLLYAISQHLPAAELKPYLKMALQRSNTTNTHPDMNIAQVAYTLWSRHFGWQSAYELRIDPYWRKQLRPDVQWNNLFNYSDNRFATAIAAVDYLHNDLLLQAQKNTAKKHRNDDYRMTRANTKIAINKIALHNDLNDLKLWMHDDNFAVALGSWLALHRIAPKQYATEVLEKSLWWQAEIEYTYGSGCIRHTAQLTPLKAALDLFSDFLRTDQIHQTLIDVPKLWFQEKPKYGRLNDSIIINNPQTFKALQKFGDKALEFYSYKALLDVKKLQQLPAQAQPEFITDSERQLSSYYWHFNAAMSAHLITLIEADLNDFDINTHSRYIYAAFKAQNEAAKKYLNVVFETMMNKAQYNKIDEQFLQSHPVWPRGWNDLKQRIIENLKEHQLEIENPSLALNLSS